MKNLNQKKWTILIIKLLITFFVIIVSFNFLVDSNGFFYRNINSKLFFVDNNTFKTQYIIKNFKTNSINLIMGSSRTQSIKKNMIENDMYKNYYNYSNPGGTPIHHLNNLNYLLKNNVKINKILLGLDYFSFTHIGNTKNYPFSIYPIDYQKFNKLTLNLYYLLSFNVLKKNIIMLKNYINNIEPPNKINLDGSVDDYKYLQLKFGEDHKFQDQKHENFSKKEILDSQKQAFQELIKLLKKNNIELQLFIPPVSYIILKYQNVDIKLEIVKEIVSQDQEIIDFAYFNDMTKNDKNFFDRSHMNFNTTKNILTEIFENKKYGYLINKNNFDEYEKFLKRNINLIPSKQPTIY